MILRKPYAFLIKNFKKINIILLVLVSYLLWKDLSLYNFAGNYVSTGIYNTVLDSVTNYVNFFTILGTVLVSGISGILLYLFKYKEKPYLTYAFILVANVITLILFLYTRYYFTMTVMDGFDLQQARLIKDIVFMTTIPYYPMIFMLLIRSVGLDLKNFGFSEDKEFIVDEQDREEVEVEVKFDKNKVIRNIKYQYRMAKYFFLEHKLSIGTIAGVTLVVLTYNVYHYVFVENKVYKPNESFYTDGYRIAVNNTYITNRDYTGNLVDKNLYYLVQETTIKNTYNYSRAFDPSNFYLFVDNDYYISTDRFNSYFQDMGTLYDKDKVIKAGDTKKILFVYEIKKPQDKSNFLLTYQNTNIKKNAKRIKIKVADISGFIRKGESNLGEEIKVPLNLNKEFNFSLTQFKIVNSLTYRYGECQTNGTCPIYEKTLVAPINKDVLFFKFFEDTYSKNEFISFLKRYGKVKYTINGKEKEQKIKYAIDYYRGDYAYILVDKEIEQASKVELVFTVRSYQYFYTLKGE